MEVFWKLSRSLLEYLDFVLSISRRAPSSILSLLFIGSSQTSVVVSGQPQRGALPFPSASTVCLSL